MLLKRNEMTQYQITNTPCHKMTLPSYARFSLINTSTGNAFSHHYYLSQALDEKTRLNKIFGRDKFSTKRNEVK